MLVLMVIVLTGLFLLSGCGQIVTRLKLQLGGLYTTRGNHCLKRIGFKVVCDTYASNEEMFAKIKSGGSGYDIVFPSGTT